MPRLSRARRRILARALESSRALEMRYANALKRFVRAMHAEVLGTLRPRLAHYARHDAGPFDTTVDGILLRYTTTARANVGPVFDRHAAGVARANARAVKLLGITPKDIGLGALISSKRQENIRLIDKTLHTYADEIKEVLSDPETFGLRVEEIAERLVERGKVSESRAELIARDQTTKLNGALNQARQQSAGVGSYVWSTSLDERVRPEHAALEGQTFSWAAAPSVGHPGEDIMCRCVAIPVFDELE